MSRSSYLILDYKISHCYTYTWYHTTKVSRRTLELVARRHGHCLKELQIYNISSYNSTVDFSALATLDAGDMDLFFGFFWASKSVANSHKSLIHLELGCERFLALLYLDGNGFLTASEAWESTHNADNNIRDHLPARFQEYSKSKVESSLPTLVLTLESLLLIGVDCGYTPARGAPTMLDIDNLTSLCLESYLNLRQSFPALSLRNPDAPSLLPQLRSFRLRQEGSDALFQDGLKAFLLASKGPVHLAILLEGSGPFSPPDCFVGNHGSTVRTLVWGQRKGPRIELDASTNTATPSMMSRFLDKIVKKCPNLRELGLAVNALTNEEHAVSQRSLF